MTACGEAVNEVCDNSRFLESILERHAPDFA